MTGISVIIPTLNEAATLPTTLESVARELDGAEVIVVDGGSTDGTREVARSAGAMILHGPAGRGAQLRHGAGRARGPVLLFLHADTRLPTGGGAAMRGALSRPGVVAGAFRLRFHHDHGRPSLPLRLLARGINLRSRLLRTATGDQAIFAVADAVRAAGGVPPIPLFDDVRLVRALKREGRFRLLRPAVLTSPRRWLRHGVVRVTLLHLRLRLLHALGWAPERLARCYNFRTGS